jgi:hypothetical protein
VTSQKPPAKKARDMTSEEAIRELFYPEVVEHAKRHLREADAKQSKPEKKSIRED